MTTVDPTAPSQATIPEGREAGHVRRSVTEHSRELRREMGFLDLALAQVLVVVGAGWVGLAAKLGQASTTMWLLGMLLFFLPLAAVVSYLNRWMPLQGGTYQWAKIAYGRGVGFLVAWNFWFFVVLFLSTLGLSFTTSLSYALNSATPWAENGPLVYLNTLLITLILALIAIRGLALGKWIHNAAGVALIVVFALVAAAPWIGSGTPGYPGFELELPELSILNLTIFTKMAVYALAGLECVALMAGECRGPGRTIGRATFAAAPVIMLIYLLGTQAVLAFVKPEEVDLIQPVSQTLRAAFAGSTVAAAVVTGAILLLVGREVAQSSLAFTASSRLPVVAAWDRRLPDWMSRLHPRFKTPVNSILLGSVLICLLSLLSLIGVGSQEAFQILQSAGGVFFAFTYLVMFSIPVSLRWSGRHRVPAGVLLCSLLGFAVVLLFVGFSVFPIVDTDSPWVYGAKVSGAALIVNLTAALVYRQSKPTDPASEG